MMQACTSKPDVEITDQGRFTKSESEENLTENEDLDLSKSYINFNNTKTYLGEVSKVKFYAVNSAGQLLSEGGLTVSFFLLGGTSLGTFGASSNPDGNGYYEADFTASLEGTATRIFAIVEGETVSSTPPIVIVGPGQYYRDITFSSATTVDDYQIRIDLDSSNFSYANANANGDDLKFYDSISGLEYDYYIANWNPSGESEVWVKNGSAGVSGLRMFYGNASLAASSDREKVFTYNSQKDLYVEANSQVINRSLGLVNYSALMAGNVSLGGTAVAPASQSANTYNNISKGLIRSDVPLSARILDSNLAVDSIAPLSFSSTLMGYSTSRGTDIFDFYNPNSVAANITINDYNSAGVLQDTVSFALGAGLFVNRGADDVNATAVIESDIPVVAYYYSAPGLQDGMIMVPGSTEIIGLSDKKGILTILENATSGTIYYSDGSSSAFAGNKGNRIDLTGSVGQVNALGVRVVSNNKVTGASQADADGTEGISFYPRSELDDEYFFPTNVGHFNVVCTEDVVISINGVVAGNCDANVNNPGYISFGSAVGVNNYPAGTRVSGDGQFFLAYEYLDLDETNITSWKQGRLYSYPIPTVSISAESEF
ncbi:Ig-like domain-containing protein [bacterium]|nr:Ig-like domain-containing protein [bacterium]